MLKFLRKYQLFILVIGGSLLMVVFLLQPVLTRIAPNPGKRKAASVGVDNDKVTRMDLERARFEAQACYRVEPSILQSTGLSLADDDTWGEHWYLLVKEAEKGGFIGGADDGLAWIDDIAPQIAQQQVIQDLQRGALSSNTDMQEALTRYTSLAHSTLQSRIQQAAGSQPGATIADVERALTRARGIRRMYSFYLRAPKPSVEEAIAEAKDALDAVQTDALVLPASTIKEDLPPASDEQLEAFFNEYRDVAPGDSEFGIGYVLQPRIKLSTLTFNAAAIADSLTPDRVELNKLWRQDRERYPGEFADERPNVEANWRAERTREIMVEIDQVVRATVRGALAGVPQQDGFYTLPDDWESKRPRWSDVASAVTTEIAQATGLRLPAPVVRMHDDRWLTAPDIVNLPGMRDLVFQVGSRRAGPAQLPAMVGQTGSNTIAPVQVGVPLSELAGTEVTSGNRTYITVLDHRGVSAAESIDEAGRERVAADELEVRAFRELQQRAATYLETARDSGLDAVADLVSPDDGDPETPRSLSPIRAVEITRDTAGRTRDPRINSPEVRDAVREAAARMDPLVDPETIPASEAFVAVAVPSSRALVVARVIAPRPLTREDFRLRGVRAIRQATNTWLLPDAADTETLPYSLDNLKERWNFQRTEAVTDEDA